MTEIVTSSSMRRQGKPTHGTSSEAPGNRKSRATDRTFLPTRRLCLTLHMRKATHKKALRLERGGGQATVGRGALGRAGMPLRTRANSFGLSTRERNRQGNPLPWHSCHTSECYLLVPTCFCSFVCPSMAMSTFLGSSSAGSGTESSSTPLWYFAWMSSAFTP